MHDSLGYRCPASQMQAEWMPLKFCGSAASIVNQPRTERLSVLQQFVEVTGATTKQ